MLADPTLCGGPIIWPLRTKLFHPVFLQQRPKWMGERRIPSLPTMPWDCLNRPPVINYGIVNLPPIADSTLPVNFGLAALGLPVIPLTSLMQPPYPPNYSWQSRIPAVVHPLPRPAVIWTIPGITKDETGAATGGFTVYLFAMILGVPVLRAITVSDANGIYSFSVNASDSYWAVDYKSGSPGKAGATLQTLTGAQS